jgi:transposase InsO family protein
VRWQGCRRYGLGLVDGTPGPKEAWHRLLPEEVASITRLACRPEYADLSHRILAVTVWEKGLCFVSFSSVYRVLKAHGLMTARGHRGTHNGGALAPVRKMLTGANQRWCWDISYLPTGEKGIYLFLYLVLDEYSRKALAWRIRWVQTSAEAAQVLETVLIQEDILDLPEDRRPKVINDRGRQMKAKPIQRLFEDHAMPQLFARPRTPTTIRSSNRPSAPRNARPNIPAVFVTTARPPLTSRNISTGTTIVTTTPASTMSPPRKPTRACAMPSFAAGRSNKKPSAHGAGPKTRKSTHHSSKTTGHQPSFL